MHTSGVVVAVCLKAEPGLPKLAVAAIQLIADHGVAGDYHAGPFVRHRYLAKKDPTRPNLRQVLLVDTTILAEIAASGIPIEPGALGENIVVDGIAMMALAVGARLQIGAALLEITEVRDPCQQLNGIHPGLLEAVMREVDGQPRPHAGMMARVLEGGWVRPGDPVSVRN